MVSVAIGVARKDANVDAADALRHAIRGPCGAVLDPTHSDPDTPADVLIAAHDQVRRWNRRTGQLSQRPLHPSAALYVSWPLRAVG